MRPVSTLLLLVGCHAAPSDSKDAPTVVGTDSAPITGDSGTTDTADSGTTEPSTVTGAVTVQLTTTDEVGNTVLLDWKEMYGKTFPFGDIFVAAYVLDEESGRPNYLSTTVIDAPVPGPNPYSLEVETTGEVYVYAALDYWGDGIIATNDPAGLYPDLVEVGPADPKLAVDITVLAPYYDFDTTGGGGSADYVVIGGDLAVGGYAGGLVATLLYDTNGTGPYYAAAATVSDKGGGSYGLTVLKDFGPARLLGAWDSNFNNLIDPDDTWGAYAAEQDVNSNPITVADTNLDGYNIQIPLGAAEPNGVPFVTLSGYIESNVDMVEWEAAGGVVYVVALTSPPPYDATAFNIDDVGSFDVMSFSGANLSGTVLNFGLDLPSNSTAYLWAFLDADNDGMLNELTDGEFKGTYLAPVGAISVAETSVEDLFIPLLDPCCLPTVR